MTDTADDSAAPFALQYDVVQLREALPGEDRSGRPHTFAAGTVGTVVDVSFGGDAFYVEVARTEGPEFPQPGHRGELMGLLWGTPEQLLVTQRHADR